MKKKLMAVPVLILGGTLAYSALQPAPMAHARLTITSPPRYLTENHTFDVEIAATDEQGKTGLSGRKTLGETAGMLFPIPDSPVSMWMKDTLIPLDILFIHDGMISKIEENTVPLSTNLISSVIPVEAVIELHAGVVKTDHIAVGDSVKY